jgi:hypothetical protein
MKLAERPDIDGMRGDATAGYVRVPPHERSAENVV